MPLDVSPSPETKASNRLAVIDSDIHPAVKSLADLRPYISNQWWDYANTYGFRRKHGSSTVEPYPKSAPLASTAMHGRRKAAVRGRAWN